jgi:membrane protein
MSLIFMPSIDLYKKYLSIFKNYWIWVFKEYVRKDCPTVAASITLSSLFAIVPAFFIIINILDTFNVFNSFSGNIQQFLFSNMLPDSANTVQEYIVSISKQMTALPVVSVFFLLVLIFMMIKRLEKTLNRIFYVQKSRSIVQSLLVYWTLMTVGPLLLGFVFVSSTYVLSMTLIFNEIGVEKYLLGGLSLLFLTGGFFVVYKILPNTKINSWIALLAAFLVAVLFIVAKKLFSVYMFYVPTYSVIYGSLSLIPIFILWVFVLWHITLLGSVMIRAMQYMRVSLDFNEESKSDDLSTSITILRELYLAQKNLIDGITMDCIYKNTGITDYDKIKNILYILERQNIIRIDGADTCYLNCDVFDISLQKIYSAFHPTLNLKNTEVEKLSAVKSKLNSDLDIKLYDCF